MEFGLITLEGLVGANTGAPAASSQGGSRASGIIRNSDGSESLNQGISMLVEDYGRASKMAKPDPFLEEATKFQLQKENGSNMLSFFSTTAEGPLTAKNAGFANRNTQNPKFLFYQQGASEPSYSTGYDSGVSNAGMHGPFARYRGPFTPSQWMELEHQALVYKYIVANVPVPAHLLAPYKKSLNPLAYAGSSSGSYASNPFGWGAFHLGFSGNTDPEPGRCRRTDGKKWRCSRDAAPDQKYCERHINRNRYRSRKPVEGQIGQVVSGSTSTKVVPIASSHSASVMSSSSTSNSLGAMQQQFKNLHPTAANPFTNAVVNRMQDTRGLSMIPPTTNMKPKDSAFPSPKQYVPIERSSQLESSHVSSDSLINPSAKSSYSNPRKCDSFLGSKVGETHNQETLLPFTHDWPKSSAVAWPEELKSDWTQLSISIPTTSSHFTLSSNSEQHEMFSTLSRPNLPHEFDYVSLGVGNDLSEPTQEQTNWLPISWGNSKGGPLGEVLKSTSSTAVTSKSSSALNLMTEMWDGRHQIGLSPTGVLQKASFVSVSNSSSGSSPRADRAPP